MGLQSLSKCSQRAGGNGYVAHVILEFGNGQTQANGIESGNETLTVLHSVKCAQLDGVAYLPVAFSRNTQSQA